MNKPVKHAVSVRSITPELQEIINQSRFVVVDGTYVYAKVRSLPKTSHFLVTKDADEMTVVTTAERLPELDLIERNKENYRLIGLAVSIPFYSVGFLAAVSSAIAKAGMNILILSTYSKDYILVKAADLEKTRAILLDVGFQG